MTETQVALEAAVKLAQQGDRVLFIVALIVLGIFGGMVVRYLVKRDERKTEQLVMLYREASVQRMEAVRVIERVTLILERVEHRLDVN